MYCFHCEKNTETINERIEEWKEYRLLKGVCKMCNKTKVKRLGLIKKQCNVNTLPI